MNSSYLLTEISFFFLFFNEPQLQPKHGIHAHQQQIQVKSTELIVVLVFLTCQIFSGVVQNGFFLSRIYKHSN